VWRASETVDTRGVYADSAGHSTLLTKADTANAARPSATPVSAVASALAAAAAAAACASPASPRGPPPISRRKPAMPPANLAGPWRAMHTCEQCDAGGQTPSAGTSHLYEVTLLASQND